MSGQHGESCKIACLTPESTRSEVFTYDRCFSTSKTVSVIYGICVHLK